jgi:ferredoxin
MSFKVTIDGQSLSVADGQTVLAAARALGLDIPTLCYLEKCGPLNSCLVCLVKINGKLVPSCGTRAEPGMVVESETEEVHDARRTALELLFSDHVGDCLSPCNRLCPLGLNIPLMIRQIQGGKLAEASATVRSALPLAGVLGRLCHHPCEQGCRRGVWDNPAGIRDLEQFVTDQEISGTAAPEKSAVPGYQLPPRQPATGKVVAVVGAGPTGLSAAYTLTRHGHAVTVLDRHDRAGGSLRSLPEEALPAAVSKREIELLAALGVEFKLGIEVSNHVQLEELSHRFDAILLTVGQRSADEAERLGLALSAGLIKSDPNTCQTTLPKVFAAGAVTRPVKHLVRAMGEGRAAAECLHRFLNGQPPRRPEKVFSSVMGRLDPGELKQFLAACNPASSVTPCDRCAGFTRPEAALESTRCLHCDCRSSGNCVLQHYAQAYGVDANRFRTERKKFEQFVQPAGIIFEPGKCILCGICVKLTELAREPLGLTFIGRGFDVQVATPFNHRIEEGLQKVAEECVRQCPTGALVFREA